jgi:hypothetical protein
VQPPRAQQGVVYGGQQGMMPPGQAAQAPQQNVIIAQQGQAQSQRPANGAAGLRAPAAIPRAPMREESAITAFDRKVGDSSRPTLIFVLIAAAALLGGVFYFAEPSEEMKQSAQEETRHALPKELVREALEKAGTTKPEEQPAVAEEEAAQPTQVAEKQTEPVEPAPVVPQFGTLNLSTDPAVDVYAGNDHLGRTPIVAKLPSGPQKIRFTDKSTGLNVYKNYKIRGGGEVRDHISFGTSELTIDAPDGASILLNSRFIGKAPLDPVKIYEGKYHLKVTLDGKSWADNFDAPPGRKINYKVTLNP